MSTDPASSSAAPIVRPWYQRIGPGLITACVVIGPGSILTSSRVGANFEYSNLWVVIVSVSFMMVYMTMGARLGVVASSAPGDLMRQKAGQWLAALLGCCVFFISAAFQSGNNLGVAAAFQAFVDAKWLVAMLLVLFNAVAIAFLFAFRNLYQLVERLMTILVAVMLISFTVNLINLKPNVGKAVRGFIPQGTESFSLDVLGLIGTTFVITAAFYQAYLVRQKGWGMSDLKNGLLDARIGSVIMAIITLVLMSTAAAGLYTGGKVELASPVDVAESLEVTFGTQGKVIFCLGLFSAAYSSFLVNSMIGGFIAADGLKMGSLPSDRGPRLMTAVALLTGMIVALLVVVAEIDITPTIVFAQAVTVVGAPLVAGVLLWLTSREDVMGKQVNSPFVKGFGLVGLLLLIAMAWRTGAIEIPKKIENYRQSLQDDTETDSSSDADGED